MKRVADAEFLVPDGLKLLEIKVPRGVSREELAVANLDPDWSGPGPKAWAFSQPLGDDWLDSGRSAVLKVPSAARPGWSNYLINPVHREADFIEVLRIHDPPERGLFA